MEQAAFDKKYIALRREFHRYPEPAWLEYRTTARIIQHLEELGLRPRWGRDIHQAEARMGLPGADTDAAWLARAVEDNRSFTVPTPLTGEALEALLLRCCPME